MGTQVLEVVGFRDCKSSAMCTRLPYQYSCIDDGDQGGVRCCLVDGEIDLLLRLICQRNHLRGILRALVAHIDGVTDRLIS